MKMFENIKTKFKKKEVSEVEEYRLKDKEVEKLSESFVSRDEKYIASLGNGYIMNYLVDGSAQKGFAFITDKRVYFKGSCLSGTGKNLVKTNEERTVDVKNITGSGFTYRRYWGILVVLFVSLAILLTASVYLLLETDYPNANEQKRNMLDLKLLEKAKNNIDKIEWDDIEFQQYFDKAYYDSSEYFANLDEDKEVVGVFFDGGERYEITICYENNVYTPAWEAWTLDDIYISNTERWQVRLGDYTSFDEVVASDLKGQIKRKINDKLDGVSRLNERYNNENALVVEICLVICLIFFPLMILCCIAIKNYLIKRETLFRIEYAGGCIAFDVSFYAKTEIDDFQKQLRRAKDMIEEKVSTNLFPMEFSAGLSTQNNIPDDLRKYADLLKEGLITEEEYDAMKKKVLGL